MWIILIIVLTLIIFIVLAKLGWLGHDLFETISDILDIISEIDFDWD